MRIHVDPDLPCEILLFGAVAIVKYDWLVQVVMTAAISTPNTCSVITDSLTLPTQAHQMRAQDT